MRQTFLSGTLCTVLFLAYSASTAAQAPSPSQPASTLKLETGKQIWDAGCVACHGPDGRGQSRSLAGFEPPDTFPDFADCLTSTVESDLQWRAVITHGGGARGFSRIMPAFRDILTPGQIDLVIGYMRSMCRDTAWPRGNLNLPRPMMTEKAFPESETVITSALNAEGDANISSTVIYEHRIGATAMWEAIIPYDFTRRGGAWGASFGDLGLGYKQKLFHSVEKGAILSAGGELIVPTGNVGLGTGGESTVFEGFAAYGQLFPGFSFVQVHTGVELPAHPDKVARAFFLRTAVGKTFATNGGLGRRWTPMVEFVGDRELETGAVMNWDVLPQIQIPLNKRLHILADVAVKLPMNNTEGRQRQVLFYVLWDWMDGGLTAGW